MRIWLGLTILSYAVNGQYDQYDNYEYQGSFDALVDFGPDNRKDTIDEKGAQSPYDRVRKISRQSRDWIQTYAKNYKKKPRLERAITRFQSRYQNALSADGCRKNPSYEQQRDFDGELSRKLPAAPEDKIEKFSKLLDKFHRLYLTSCKKANRLEEVNNRFKRQFLGAYKKMQNCKKCDYNDGKNDHGVFAADVEETTVLTETAQVFETTKADTTVEMTTTEATTTTTLATTTTTTTPPPPKTKRPKKNKKKAKEAAAWGAVDNKFDKPFAA